MDENLKIKNVFTNRNYRLVFFGALVSEMGSVLYSFAVSFYILEISGNNAFLQGLYLAICGIVLLLFTPVGGVIGDRYHRGKIMFLCDYLKGGIIVAAAVMMMLLPEPGAHIAILFVSGIIGNAVSGVFSPAAGAILPKIVEMEQIQQGNAYFSARSSLQSIFGVVLAGILYAALPINLLFIIVGICYVLSGVSEMFIRYEHVPSEERLTIRLALSDMKDGLFYLRQKKEILAMMVAALFINFFASPIWGNFIPYFIKTDIAPAPSYLFDRLLTPELWSSVFSVLMGISSLLASILISGGKPREKVGHLIVRRICGMAAIIIALTASYGILVSGKVSLNAFLLLFCLGCFLLGFVLVFINIPLNTVLMRVVDEKMLSKVSSFISVLSQGLVPIASVIAGAVLQGLGILWLLIICAAGFTITAVLMIFNRDIRNI